MDTFDTRGDVKEAKVGPSHVRCPYCNRMTDHIQAHGYPVVVFALVYVGWSWNDQIVFGCPPCARKQLRSHALLSLVMANIFCLIPVPAILARIWASYADTQPFIPPEYYYLADVPPRDEISHDAEAKARRKRLLVVFVILIVVGAFLLFLLPDLAGGK